MPSWNESMWFAVFAGVALKSTAVLGVAWLAAFLLRGRSAAARHLVWTAAAAAVLALPLLSISLPSLSLPAVDALASNVSLVFQTSATARADRDSSHISPQASAPAPRQPASWRPDWRLSLMLLWAAGSAAALTQMLAACAGMWRVRRAAKPSPDRGLSVALAQGLGIRHPVDVLGTAEGTMPMTFGIVRPAVFLPSDAMEWSEERRRIVLLHELAHVRRGDSATQLVARLALILNWWNPLAWAAWREFLKERERAADDIVLQAGARASDYAGHLLEMARTRHASLAMASAAVAMARRSQLEGRLLAILDSGVNRKTAGPASALVAALAAVAIVAPLAAVHAQDRASHAIPADVEATLRAAVAQKNHEMLDKAAAAFEAVREYETAQRLLESAAAIRQEVSGAQSADYGIGLLKIAAVETKRNRQKEAEALYTKALLVLGDRPEAAPALLNLGLLQKNPDEAIDYFQRAQRLDPSLSGQAMLWMALSREREQNPAEAEVLYKSALAALNPDSADALNTLELYGRFLNEQGREAEGKAMQERATALLKTLHPQTAGNSSNALRAGGDVKPPSLSYKVDPEYSQEARFAKYSGKVVLFVEIAPDGIAGNIQIVNGIGLGLDEKAIEAIGKWRFRPGTKEGVPVTVQAHIEVNFRLM
jgi:TonB family protein